MTRSKLNIDWGEPSGPMQLEVVKKYKTGPEKPKPKLNIDWGEEQQPAQAQVEALKQQHPMMYKIAEQLQQHPFLNKVIKHAGESGQLVSNAVEQLGLPAFAKGFLSGPVNLTHGIADLIPGVEFPRNSILETKARSQPLPYSKNIPNPITGKPLVPEGINISPIMQAGGEFTSSAGPVGKLHQGIAKGISKGGISEPIANILAAPTTGFAVSPHERGMGTLLGGASAIPMALQYRNALSSQALAKMQQEQAGYNEALERAQAEAKHNFGVNKPLAIEQKLGGLTSEIQNAIADAAANPMSQVGPHQPSAIIERNAREAADQAYQQIQHSTQYGQHYQPMIADNLLTKLKGQLNPQTGRREFGYEQAIGHQYDVLLNDMRNLPEPINLPLSQKQVKPFEDYINNHPTLSRLGTDGKEQALNELIRQANINQTVNAADAMQVYRGLKQQVHRLNTAYWKNADNIQQQDIIRPMLEDTEARMHQIGNLLNQHLGGQWLGRLRRIDSQWSKDVAPLAKNNIYQGITKDNPSIPSDFLDQIYDPLKPGNHVLRQMLEQDQQLQDLAFAHKFAANPRSVLEPNSRLDNIMRLNPDINNLVHDARYRAAQLDPRIAQAQQVKALEIALQKHDLTRAKYNHLLKLEEEITNNLANKEMTAEKIKAEETKYKKMKFITDAIKSAVKYETMHMLLGHSD